MSLNKEAYLRYKIIDQCIGNKYKQHPSMEDIKKACTRSLGKEFTTSTIQKDIKAMKEDEQLGFFAPIKYSKSYDGYYYSDAEFKLHGIRLQEDEKEALKSVTELLQVFSGNRISESFDNAVVNILQAVKVKTEAKEVKLPSIITDDFASKNNWQVFNTVLSAIRNKCVVCYLNYSFEEGKQSPAIFNPYQLKQFQDKWYVLGLFEKAKSIQAIQLENIIDPVLLQRPFDESKINELALFKNMYGLRPIKKLKVEEIKFCAHLKLAKELVARPLHTSQKAISEDIIGSTEITIEVIPTHELAQWFMTNQKFITLKNASIQSYIAEHLYKNEKDF